MLDYRRIVKLVLWPFIKGMYHRFRYGKFGKPFTIQEVTTHLDKMKLYYPNKVDEIERLKQYFSDKEWNKVRNQKPKSLKY